MDTEATARPARRFEWRSILPIVILAVLAPLNFLGIWILAGSSQVGVAPDFQEYAAALERFIAGDPLYVSWSKWRYSPVALLTMAPFISLGLAAWTTFHLLAVLLIRPWRLALLFGLSWPFWVDVVAGNTVTFVAVAGIVAMRGSRAAAYTYWWLTLVIPRPVQVPLAVYLAWKRPELRLGFIILTAVNLVLLLVVGQGAEWISYILARGAENTDAAFNIHPAADLGMLWLVIGLPAAVILTWRGFPGQAGVVVSPSLLSQYLLMAFVPPDSRARASEEDASPADGRSSIVEEVRLRRDHERGAAEDGSE